MKHVPASAILLFVFVAFAGCSQASRLASNAITIEASWGDNAVDYRGNIGTRYVYVCPPNPSKSGVGMVWGTDTYSDDSSVCAAAVHAGKITFAGGSATIEMRRGLDSYTGSIRNGVATQDWPSWHGSFVVLQ